MDPSQSEQPFTTRRLSGRRRFASAVGAAVISAAILRPSVHAQTEDQDYVLERAFTGGGPVGLGQCTESGEARVGVQVWDDAFALALKIPADERIPCLGSRLPEDHLIEVFGESLDGEVHGLLVPKTRWLLSMSADHGPAIEIGDAEFVPSTDGRYALVWSEGPPKGFPDGLELWLVSGSMEHDEHDEGLHDEGVVHE